MQTAAPVLYLSPHPGLLAEPDLCNLCEPPFPHGWDSCKGIVPTSSSSGGQLCCLHALGSKKKNKKPKNHKKTQQPLMTAGRMASSCSLICPGCSRNPALHPGNPSLSRLPTHRADFLFAIMGKKKSLIIFFPPLITHITDFFFLPPTPYIYFIVPRHPLTATVTHGQRAPVAAAPSPGPTGLPAASLQTTKPR